MNEHHKKMVNLLQGIKEKSYQRDVLVGKLEVAIAHTIQNDLDKEKGITEDVKEFYNTFNMNKYNVFVDKYEGAVMGGQETFEFEGREVYIGFAERVIDFVYPGFRGHPGAKKRK